MQITKICQVTWVIWSTWRILVRPYKQIKEGEKIVRTFSNEVSEDELVWHRDREDRLIEVIKSGGWCLQLDEEMPTTLVEGSEYFIPKETFHRVIKGFEDLVVAWRNNDDC